MEDIITPPTPSEQPIYAGFWRRFAAYIIDRAVISVALLPLALFFLRNSGLWDFIQISRSLPPGVAGLIREGDATDYAIIVQNVFKELSYYALCHSLLILIYYSFWESSKFQATPGKLAVRLKVMQSSGERISFMRALGRNICKILSSIILMIGYIMAGFTEKQQALHDIITDCIIIKPEHQTEPNAQHAYAGFWRRFVAYILDGILLSIVLSPIKYILMPASYNKYISDVFKTIFTGEQPPLPPINDLILVSALSTLSTLLTFFYFASWESSRHQATPGKLAIGIKVVDINGQRLSFWRASGRYVNKIISGLTLLIGYMMAGWTKHSQALHDELSDTLVIKA